MATPFQYKKRLVNQVRNFRDVDALVRQMSDRISWLESQLQSRQPPYLQAPPPASGLVEPIPAKSPPTAPAAKGKKHARRPTLRKKAARFDSGNLDDIDDGDVRKLSAAAAHIATLFPGAVIDVSGGFIDINNVTNRSATPFNTIETTESYTGFIKLNFRAYVTAGTFINWFFFDASGNAYFVIIGGNGSLSAQIFTVTAGGVQNAVSANYNATRFDNTTFSGSIQIHTATGHFVVHVNGIKVLSLVDKTFTINGPIGYGMDITGGSGFLYKVAVSGHNAVVHTAQETTNVPKRAWTKTFTGLTPDPTDGNQYFLPTRVGVTGFTCQTNAYFVGDWEVKAEVTLGTNDAFEVFQGDNLGNGYLLRVNATAGTGAQIFRYDSGTTTFVLLAQEGAAEGTGITFQVVFKRHKTGHFEVYVTGSLRASTQDTTYPANNPLFFTCIAGATAVGRISVKGGHVDTPSAFKDSNKIIPKPWTKFWSGLTSDPTDGNRYLVPLRSGAPATSCTTPQVAHNDYEIHFDVEFGPTNSIFEVFIGDNTGANGYLFQVGNVSSGAFALLWRESTLNNFVNIASSSAATLGTGPFSIIIKRHKTGHYEIWVNGDLQVSVQDTTFNNEFVFLMYTGNQAYVNNVHWRLGHTERPYAYLDSNKATITGGISPNATSNTAEDRETGAHALSVGNFTVIARIASYTADAANNHLRFDIQANISLTNFTFDNGSSQKDSLQWEIVVDDGNAVGSNITGGTVISGPHPVAPGLNNTTAGSCSPQISIVGKPPKYVVPDANAHSYSLAVKLVNGGAGTVSGTTVLGSTVIPSAVLELHELKR